MTLAFAQSTLSTGKRRKLLLLAGAAAALFPVHGAYAQAGDDSDEAAGDPIVVTGSRIRGVAPVGSNLIDVGAEQIEKSGATTVSDVLRQVPQVTSLSINAEGATGAGAGSNITRATGPNLRGLGSTATLVVVDGLRVPIAGTQGNFVDPSFVPSLAIQRLEVIADGASAIYGSDAVAGVINLIPRKNFTGLEVRGKVGLADAYTEYQVSGIAGGKWDTGNLVVSAEYLRNDALLGSDRDFVSADRRWGGGADARSIACSPATITANGTTYAVPSSTSGTVDFNSLTAGTANRCDLSKPGFLIPEQERISLYGYFNQELGSTFSLFAQGFYSRREFSGPIAGQYSVTNLAIPDTNPFIINAPAGAAVSTNFIDTVGLSNTQGQSETYLVNAGIRGTFGEWEVKLAGSYGESSDEENRDPGINAAALSAALANPNPAQSINPFGTSANNPSLVDSVYLDMFNPAVTNQLRSVELEANGPLFTIPGGEVRMALGAEYREEHQFGAFTFGPKTSPISLPNDITRDVKAVFAELYVPIVGDGNAGPGLQRLDLSVAVRHEEYSDFGKTTNPKIGLTWSPLDGLNLRGSYGTSFRAPGLAEVDANSSGAGIYQIPFVVPGQPLPLNLALVAAGNPNLQPETAETWSAGFDFTPSGLPGFRFGATYFDVTYEGQVIDVFTIVPQVLAEPQNFGDLVFLNDGGARWDQGIDFITSTQYYIPGSINFNLLDGIIDARKANLGTTKASGMDFDTSYQFAAGDSEFTIGANATLFFNYEDATGAGATTSRLGTYGFPQKFRGRAMLGWTRGPISAQATLNHLSGYKNLTSALVQNVSSYTTVDFDLGYTFGEESGGLLSGVRLGLNARNLFDRDPPFVDAGLGYDPSAASALGRIVSFSVSKAL